MYRVHYQTDAQEGISPKPDVNPDIWQSYSSSGSGYIALAYVEADSVAEAYERYCRAIIWWNTHIGGIVSQGESLMYWDDLLHEKVELFMRYPREKIAPSRAPGIYKPVQKLPLRLPLPGDVFEPTNTIGHGYMLVQPKNETLPYQWLWITPYKVIACSEDVKWL